MLNYSLCLVPRSRWIHIWLNVLIKVEGEVLMDIVFSLPSSPYPPHHPFPFLFQAFSVSEDGSLGTTLLYLPYPQYSKCNQYSANRGYLLKLGRRNEITIGSFLISNMRQKHEFLRYRCLQQPSVSGHSPAWGLSVLRDISDVPHSQYQHLETTEERFGRRQLNR